MRTPLVYCENMKSLILFCLFLTAVFAAPRPSAQTDQPLPQDARRRLQSLSVKVISDDDNDKYNRNNYDRDEDNNDDRVDDWFRKEERVRDDRSDADRDRYDDDRDKSNRDRYESSSYSDRREGRGRYSDRREDSERYSDRREDSERREDSNRYSDRREDSDRYSDRREYSDRYSDRREDSDRYSDRREDSDRYSDRYSDRREDSDRKDDSDRNSDKYSVRNINRYSEGTDKSNREDRYEERSDRKDKPDRRERAERYRESERSSHRHESRREEQNHESRRDESDRNEPEPQAANHDSFAHSNNFNDIKLLDRKPELNEYRYYQEEERYDGDRVESDKPEEPKALRNNNLNALARQMDYIATQYGSQGKVKVAYIPPSTRTSSLYHDLGSLNFRYIPGRSKEVQFQSLVKPIMLLPTDDAFSYNSLLGSPLRKPRYDDQDDDVSD